MSVPDVQTGSPAPEHFTLIHLDGPQADLPGLLKSEAAKAAAQGRRLFVEFYADWCGPCKRLASHLADPRMVDALDGTYIVKLNSDDWKWPATEAGFALNGIPAFFEIAADGRPTGRTINGGAWEEDTPENMAPPLKAFFSGRV